VRAHVRVGDQDLVPGLLVNRTESGWVGWWVGGVGEDRGRGGGQSGEGRVLCVQAKADTVQVRENRD